MFLWYSFSPAARHLLVLRRCLLLGIAWLQHLVQYLLFGITVINLIFFLSLCLRWWLGLESFVLSIVFIGAFPFICIVLLFIKWLSLLLIDILSLILKFHETFLQFALSCVCWPLLLGIFPGFAYVWSLPSMRSIGNFWGSTIVRWEDLSLTWQWLLLLNLRSCKIIWESVLGAL